MEFCFRYNEMKGHVAGAGDSPVNLSLTMPSAGCSLKVRAELKKLCNRAVHICKVIKLLSLVVCCAFPWCMIESASYFKKLILTLSQLFKVLHY